MESRAAAKKVLLICLLALAMRRGGFSPVFAQTDVWVSLGPEGGNIYALAIDPQTPSTLYAGTDGGDVFRSTDGGASWSAVILTYLGVLDLAIDPATPTTLYAGTGGEGAFKSTDGGANWSAVNTGLTNTDVLALAIDPQSPTTLYVGAYDSGVWKIRFSETSVEENTSGFPKNVTLLQNYPNPFNPVTTIAYQVKEACRVTLEVVDLNGKAVTHLVDEKQQPGAYTVRFDGRELPSGIYFCRIRMGGFEAVKKMAVVK